MNMNNDDRIANLIAQEYAFWKKKLNCSDEINIYVCGPTTYEDIHIGNLRTFYFFNVVRNYLEYLGFKVNFCMNFTDIDDKIINRAIKENIPFTVISDFYTDKCTDTLKSMNIIKDSDFLPRATNFIPEMLSLTYKLIDTNLTYVADDGLYCKIDKNRYFVLSKPFEAEKEDFVLWKKTEHNPFWRLPWFKGRPGWHLECVAMSNTILKDVTIHGGGIDIMFPHHENEIYIYDSIFHKKMVQQWLHVAPLVVTSDNGEKMSKSKNNVIYLPEFLLCSTHNVLKLMYLNNKFDSIMSFDITSVDTFNKKLEKFWKIIDSNGEDEISKDILEDIFFAMRTFNFPYVIGKIFASSSSKVNKTFFMNIVSYVFQIER